MSDVQKKLQALSDDYQTLQGELSGAVEARQKLESQQQENTNVKKVRTNTRCSRKKRKKSALIMAQEFDLLADDTNIYKQIGPVLLKQDKTEAVMSVSARLDFINKDIARIEKQIQDTQDKSEKLKMEIIQIQSAAQQAQETAA
ncbi:prefoldin subunit 6 [Paraphaeosphaeria minitans]|uniref:Prefoldin subunit 6 n=1 Tax=Paraphaeosphaeria minitans TaxID=565426 RepID=A0A9P6G9V9_9PLEO|nr:prefoldin subunit 6 [Paraphaeosphaeria minitans]